MKTAAVYDRWLFTLGGGEQVAFGFALMLRDLGYKTTILTHKYIDKKKAEAKLNVDLKGIVIEYLPTLSSNEMSQYTEEYDVFVNTSYLDYFPNRSKVGILSVFFPSKIFLSPFEYIKRALIIPSFRRFFVYPTSFEGFLYDQFDDGKIYKWMSKRSSIIFNADIGDLAIDFYFKTITFSVLEKVRFFLDDKEIHPLSHRLSDTKNIAQFRFSLQNTKEKRFTIELPESEYANSVALLRLNILDWRYMLYNVFKKRFPTWEMRLHGGPGITKRSDLESYDSIVTISQFSRKWIRQYWGLDSQILYPTTNTSLFLHKKRKKNWIIHVGRFFVTGHSKKQLELVKVFTLMANQYDCGDWELHFVGSVHEGERHQQYFEQVQEQAKGYPVFFHMDVPFEELRSLLLQAKIYWHATGLDENEQTQPILFEHFGITTVEAMASGCVPIVINAGGQKEIVTKESGMIWNTRDELMHDTMKLIENPSLLSELSKGAIERSLYFDQKAGKERFATLLKKLQE